MQMKVHDERKLTLLKVGAALLVCACMSLSSFGQSFTGDARRIGMGGTGDNENAGSQMIDDQRQYKSIVVPLGLIQVIKDRRYFDPSNDAFNPVRLLEDAANPLHLSLRRGAGSDHFVNDIVNATLNRDLNAYRGFIPAKEITAQGLMAPSFGHLFRFEKTAEGNFSGIYVGAGPYIFAKTVFNVDEQLRQVLASSTNVALNNLSFALGDKSAGEAAAAITVGYRGRLSLPGRLAAPGRNGIYVATNYHYLHGIRYDSADLRVRLDTDSAGLILPNPAISPVLADHMYSNKGNGFAIDLGVGAVVDHWEFGVGANGIANRINWENLRSERFTLQNVITGADFVRLSIPSAITTTKVEVPVDTNGNVRYNGNSWSALAQVGHGFQGTTFHGGVEKRMGPIEVRGGARYARELWHPAVGLGFNLLKGFGIDLAAFDTTGNIQRERRPSYAMSLRFNTQPKEN